MEFVDGVFDRTTTDLHVFGALATAAPTGQSGLGYTEKITSLLDGI